MRNDVKTSSNQDSDSIVVTCTFTPSALMRFCCYILYSLRGTVWEETYMHDGDNLSCNRRLYMTRALVMLPDLYNLYVNI